MGRIVPHPRSSRLVDGTRGEGDRPDVDVYALGTYDADEDRRVNAMVRALDWAVTNSFHVVTYSAPVTAGLVALLKSVDPLLTPSDCRRILMDASRAFTFEGRTAPRVPDALRAVEIARAGRTEAHLSVSQGSRY
jgi:subtilisin family serine protease